MGAAEIIPPPSEIRELIQEHFAEIRLLRSLLRVAEKAEQDNSPYAKRTANEKEVALCK